MTAPPPRILVSACLLGQPVRYDGAAKTVDDPRIERWRREGRLVTICPELAGGLGVPRRPAERQGERVVDDAGDDVSGAFDAGAHAALVLARSQDCRFALLKQGSPSCGSVQIGDGSFTGRRVPGMGITAELLSANGIRVFGEDQIDALDAALAATPR
ncbi:MULTISPECIES: DUF523 domain-containing protein [unclassified Sphingomonas]|uniref:DUF523 domain-containing protein n=1 Tax=unclassified Sphingomonas TaxID=196159 RepID=UPI00082C6EB0|nr:MULTISPECIES: DUF523 domain-containing protein [unclassified Sphingomonas]